MTRRDLLARALKIIAEEQALYCLELLRDSILIETSEELCNHAKASADRMVTNLKVRIDALKAEARS